MELDFDKINESLKNVKRQPSTLIKDDGMEPVVHQIWTLKNGKGEIPSYLLCITEILDESLVNVSPLFRWTELAGPEDLKLPDKFVGGRAVFSFEISATVNMNELDYCIGRFDDEASSYIAEAKEKLEKGEERPPFSWGYDYLDELDVRYKYHAQIVSEIQQRQQSIVDEVFGETAGNVTIFPQVPWSVLKPQLEEIELPLAGDDGVLEGHSRYMVIPTADIKESSEMEKGCAPCLQFDGVTEDGFCEWRFESGIIPDESFKVAVYHMTNNGFLGEAKICLPNHDDSIHVLLKTEVLKAVSDGAVKPEHLALIIGRY